MIENTFNGKATVNFDGSGLNILIPSRKNWLIIIFTIAWMGGWYMGESTTISQISANMDISVSWFAIFWLIGWTIAGVFMLAVLIWTLLGSERIMVDRQLIQIEKQILKIGIIKKEYEMNSVKHLEMCPGQSISDLLSQKKAAEFWGMTGGKIKFDYGMKTIKFGVGIDEAEAKFLINEIEKKGYYKHID